jgi:hypothetical protein
MVGIAFFAVCSTAIREEIHPRAQLIFNGTLPMLSALLLSTLLTVRSERGRQFLTGFQIFGWIALLSLSVSYYYFPTLANRYFNFAYLRPAGLTAGLPPWPKSDPMRFKGVVFHRPDYRMGLLYLVHTVAVTGPELAIALFGGLLFSSYRQMRVPCPRQR